MLKKIGIFIIYVSWVFCAVFTVWMLWQVSPFKEKREIDRHAFIIPDALKTNTEYLVLVEGWRALEKMDSWTPAHSRAEESLKRTYRQFLAKNTDTLVAIALTNVRIRIDHHHTRIHSLDYSKAGFEILHILHVLHKDLVPEEIEQRVRQILQIEDVIDDEGIAAARAQLTALEIELAHQKGESH